MLYVEDSILLRFISQWPGSGKLTRLLFNKIRAKLCGTSLPQRLAISKSELYWKPILVVKRQYPIKVYRHLFERINKRFTR